MANPLNLPDFKDLPPLDGLPQGFAWGVFDGNNDESGSKKKDVYGTLNTLTPEIVQAAAREVTEGISVSLNWPLDAIKKPVASRAPLAHTVLPFTLHEHGYIGLDDEVRFNTQCSSQWDSLCHYPHQASGCGYNGAKPSVAELSRTGDEAGGAGNTNIHPTLEHWHARGCLVARGVLLDYTAYAARHNIQYSPFDSHAITVADLEACACEQANTTLRFGDVLLIRSGFTEAMSGLTGDEQAKMLYAYRFCGLEGSLEMAAWLWDHHFAAAAGDSISFEVSPPQINGKDATLGEYVLHPYLLSGFGMPIGELWDLKELAATCARLQRWSFLLTSVPLNVRGEIGSPPNAVAVF